MESHGAAAEHRTILPALSLGPSNGGTKRFMAQHPPLGVLIGTPEWACPTILDSRREVAPIGREAGRAIDAVQY